MNVGNFLKSIQHWFASPKVEAAFAQVGTIVQIAQPIVQEIAALTPNKTLQEVVAAFGTYAVPVSAQLTNDPTQLGNALLNLATAVVQRNLKNPAALNIVQTAVQLAVTAVKASSASGEKLPVAKPV